MVHSKSMYTFVCVFVEMICITLQVKTPHVTGVGHTKALLNEVKDQVILGTYIYIYTVQILQPFGGPKRCPDVKPQSRKSGEWPIVTNSRHALEFQLIIVSHADGNHKD